MSEAIAAVQFARAVPEKTGSSHWLQVYITIQWLIPGSRCGVAYIRKVNDRFASCTTEDVQEGERDHIDSIILAIGRQSLLGIGAVLTPITGVHY